MSLADLQIVLRGRVGSAQLDALAWPSRAGPRITKQIF